MRRPFTPPPQPDPADDGIAELVAALPESWDQADTPAGLMDALWGAHYTRCYYELLISDTFTRSALAELVARGRDS